MNNKKGFTLIELLAIIVILAVIMAIAIPQVLNVVNGSKESAWKDNIKMISKAIELNTQMFDVETGGYTYTVDSLCKNPTKVNEISKSTDTTVTCSDGMFTISGTGQFDGFHAEINCSSGNCNSSTYAKGAYCDESVGHIWNFDYTGSEQKFITPCQGTYKIEAWGAQGGSLDDSSGGLGGYTKGNIALTNNQTLYVYVGATASNSTGGYNGGADGRAITDGSYTGGGGATDIRLTPGKWDNFESLKSRIMVAGAGAGSGSYISKPFAGGSAGGLIGNEGTFSSCDNSGTIEHILATGGTQNSGGSGIKSTGINYSSKFGYATLSPRSHTAGGGSGYYGGGSGGDTKCYVSGGAGGSSFISGHNGCDAIAESSTENNITHTGQPNHYSGNKFTDTVMIDGAGCKWTNKLTTDCSGQPQPDGTVATGHSENGYARITYIGNN